MNNDLISAIKEWFDVAIPTPEKHNQSVQIGCHFEEVAEMTDAIMRGSNLCNSLTNHANNFKNCHPLNIQTAKLIAESKTRKTALLDALCDQIVTAVGIAHMFGIDIHGALAEVNRSNYSKFENGRPVFNESGKIKKGENYTPPELEQFVNHETHQ
ncbi:TPA: hypothetical protein ACFP4Q_000791 [Neisseria weaveri]